MEDMILVSKADSANGSGSTVRGRPKRKGFCLRRNDKLYMLGIPSGAYEDGDRINFFFSPTGFAVTISPNGERAISGKLTNRTAMIPRKISDCMANTSNGVTELIAEERQDKTWFFPFSQFSAQGLYKDEVIF
jgi:hypothetical protein